MGENYSRTVKQKSKAVLRLNGTNPLLNGIQRDIFRNCALKRSRLIMKRNSYVYGLYTCLRCVGITEGQLVCCLNRQIPGTFAGIKRGVWDKACPVLIGSVLQAIINCGYVFFILRKLKSLQMFHTNFI
ncbi:hypothetical protein D3C73_1222910 [compost metagenome]